VSDEASQRICHAFFGDLDDFIGVIRVQQRAAVVFIRWPPNVHDQLPNERRLEQLSGKRSRNVRRQLRRTRSKQ
jgi:hypothetical protein